MEEGWGERGLERSMGGAWEEGDRRGVWKES